MNKVETQTVAEFKPETWGAFINGEFVPAVSGKTFPTFNPGNGEICGHLAECDEEDIDKAVRAALAAYPVSYTHLDVYKRQGQDSAVYCCTILKS